MWLTKVSTRDRDWISKKNHVLRMRYWSEYSESMKSHVTG